MKKLIALVVFLLMGCPNPETGKIDPYLTARTVINQANVGVALADGIFNQWVLAQSDAEKAKKAQITYQGIKTNVLNGLQVALNGVAIAEQAKKDPNVTDLMVAANNAWDSLRNFMEDLFTKQGDTTLVTATSQPTTKEGVRVMSSTISIRLPLNNLPKKLY